MNNNPRCKLCNRPLELPSLVFCFDMVRCNRRANIQERAEAHKAHSAHESNPSLDIADLKAIGVIKGWREPYRFR